MQNFVEVPTSKAPPATSTRRALAVAIAVLAAVFLFAGTAFPAWAADNMTLTFVRHGQSTANAEGITDTSVPGPSLTELGEQQAEERATELLPNGYDAIYASNMVRTQQTALPLALDMGLTAEDIQVLPGLREIEAGIFEGTPETLGGLASTLFAVQWILGNQLSWIPGSINGYDFDSRMDESVQFIYDNRDPNNPNSVAYSHLGTIMAWTAMNVKNPDLIVMITNPLPNTGVVVITGNPEDGWTLESWNGVEVAAEPSLPTKLFLDFRTLVKTTSDSVYNVAVAVSAGDFGEIPTAILSGAFNVAVSPYVFVGSVIGDLVGAIGGLIPVTTSAVGADVDATEAKAVASSVGDSSDVGNRTSVALSGSASPVPADDSEYAAADVPAAVEVVSKPEPQRSGSEPAEAPAEESNTRSGVATDVEEAVAREDGETAGSAGLDDTAAADPDDVTDNATSVQTAGDNVRAITGSTAKAGDDGSDAAVGGRGDADTPAGSRAAANRDAA